MPRSVELFFASRLNFLIMGAMAARAPITASESASIPLARTKTSWVPPVLIVLAILATFWTVCTAEFTSGDDQENLTANEYLNPPTFSSLAHFWAHPYAHVYIPLTDTVWWVLVRVAGLNVPDANGIWLNPYVFHSANLLMHIGVCLVVYQLLRLLTGRTSAACAGALLFALHPLQVESVAWATGMKDLLSGLLSLIALWQYLRFAQDDPRASSGRSQSRENGGRTRWWHYGAATAALLAALLAKPSAVSIPVLALILDRVMLRRPWRQIAAALAPWVAVSAAFVGIGMLAQPVEGRVNLPLWARPLVAGDSLAFYLEKLCMPIRLATRYPHSVDVVLASWRLKVAWLAPAALLAVAWFLRRRAPWLLAGTLIFAAAPLPVLGLVPFVYQRLSTVADRYVYVAMLGPSLALAGALATDRFTRFPVWLRSLSGACIVGAIGLLAFLSARQARVWQNSDSLYGQVLELDPSNDIAWVVLAKDALEDNRLAEAERYVRHACELAPDNPDHAVFLAVVLEAENRSSQAINVLMETLRRHPDNVSTMLNLADALANNGHSEQAMVFCRGAISLDPENATAHRYLAMLLLEKHENQQAVAEAAEAVRIEPSVAINHLVYGKTLSVIGRQSEADRQFSEAHALDPNAGKSTSNHPAH